MTRHFFTILATVGIVVLSTIPIPDNPPLEGVPMIDKWVHFVMYGGLVCAMWMDHYFVRKRLVASLVFCMVTIIYPALLGGLMEIVQENLTTYRNGDWQDFWADNIGVAIGFIFSYFIYRMLVRRFLNR